MKWGKELRKSVLVLPLVLGALSFGCATSNETTTLHQSINMLYDRVQNLERRVEGSEYQGQKSADLYARIEELQMRLGAMNGRMDELEHKLSQVGRPAVAPTPPPAPPVEQPPAIIIPPSSSVPSTPPPTASGGVPAPSPQQPPRTSSAKPVQTPPPPPPAPAPAPPPLPESPEKAMFDKASQMLQQGQYEGARKEFQSFLSKYPKSEWADNALYSVGECYLSEKKYQDAIESFQRVLDRYPKGNKVPHALLKQGAAFQQMGDATAARILYERLVEKYPGTPQAQVAEKKLKQM